MNFKEMSLKKQVNFLKSLLKSEESTITGYLAVSAFKHHLISKEHPTAQLKPLLRWYNGQLVKEFIKKYYKEAKAALEYFCAIGLLNVKAGQYNGLNEYHLDEALFPALHQALEEVFGKEHIAKLAAGVKYYRFPQDRKGEREGMAQNFSEVKEVRVGSGILYIYLCVHFVLSGICDMHKIPDPQLSSAGSKAESPGTILSIDGNSRFPSRWCGSNNICREMGSDLAVRHSNNL